MVFSPSFLSLLDHRRDAAGLRYVYPVLSRRAGGISIGINLNPNNACNWRCVYCQVPGLVRGKAPEIDLERLEQELNGFLAYLLHEGGLERYAPEGLRHICDIAFSGNGEPTSADVFLEAIETVIKAREAFGLNSTAQIRLITNGSLVARPQVQKGIACLGTVGGEVWFKVDAGTQSGLASVNGINIAPDKVARNLRRCSYLCKTWVQTCLFRRNGIAPQPDEIEAYLDLLKKVGTEQLAGVLLYGLARESMQPGAGGLSRLSEAELSAIAERIKEEGLTVTVSP